MRLAQAEIDLAEALTRHGRMTYRLAQQDRMAARALRRRLGGK